MLLVWTLGEVAAVVPKLGSRNERPDEIAVRKQSRFERRAMSMTARASDHIRRRPSNLFPITVRPTQADVSIARAVARNTAPAAEVDRALTWGADEKVLLLLAMAGWIVSRSGGDRLQRMANHARAGHGGRFAGAARPEAALARRTPFLVNTFGCRFSDWTNEGGGATCPGSTTSPSSAGSASA
jgi:hypothetical protein